jgi:hypothetical protein
MEVMNGRHCTSIMYASISQTPSSPILCIERAFSCLSRLVTKDFLLPSSLSAKGI